MSQINNSSTQFQNPSRLRFDEEVSVVCQHVGMINSKGLWFHDDPLEYTLPLLLVQLSLISIITRSIYIFLKPLGQPSIVSHILVSSSLYMFSHANDFLLYRSDLRGSLP